jgi:K+-transporting ATPase ATPase B chain
VEWTGCAQNLLLPAEAIEAAGDTDVLLLDKTGTITLGNRMATEFIPAEGIPQEQLADAAQLASLADETPEGRSIVVLAKEKFNIRAREMHSLDTVFIPFTAQSSMSGIDLKNPAGQLRSIRKGSSTAIRKFIENNNGFQKDGRDCFRSFTTEPLLVVAENNQVLCYTS